jgi:hypothetical protein
MKIVLIVYAVSWLILLAIFFYQREESNFSWKESDGIEKFAVLLIVLFAPVVVLFVPYLLWSRAKQKKKDKKLKEEREHQKQVEEQYRRNALLAIKQAKAAKSIENSSNFGVDDYFLSSSSLYKTIQKEENYGIIMQLLSKLTLPHGTTLHVEKCKQEGTGSRSKVVIETSDGAYDLNIWNYINVEDSKEGAWHAYLLYNLWHVLPLFWHANYDRRNYLFHQSDAKLIECYNREDAERLCSSIGSFVISPEVVQTKGKYYVSSCYFTNFGGLIQEIIEISLSNGKATFHEIERRTLFEYQCGILF